MEGRVTGEPIAAPRGYADPVSRSTIEMANLRSVRVTMPDFGAP